MSSRCSSRSLSIVLCIIVGVWALVVTWMALNANNVNDEQWAELFRLRAALSQAHSTPESAIAVVLPSTKILKTSEVPSPSSFSQHPRTVE